MSKPKVGIVIVNYNGKALLKDCLNSIRKNTNSPDYEIVVVDNASIDGSLEMLKKQFKEVAVIRTKENLGFPKANNLGTKYLLKEYRPDYFYFLNNDTKVTKNWLVEAIKVSKEHNADLVTSKQLDFDGNPCKIIGKINFLGVTYYYGDTIREVEWANGATFLLTKKVIEEIGFLDEKYSPAYYEESDFEMRAKGRGFKIFYAPKSLVYHKGGQTSKNIKSDYITYVFYRNRIRFFFKYYPKWFFLPRFFFDVFKAIKEGRVRSLFKAYKDGINLMNKK